MTAEQRDFKRRLMYQWAMNDKLSGIDISDRIECPVEREFYLRYRLGTYPVPKWGKEKNSGKEE